MTRDTSPTTIVSGAGRSPTTAGCSRSCALRGFQSGLSWLTILRKRENFRAAFCGFDIAAVAAFEPADVERLLDDAGIVRHRGKIVSAVNNASRATEVIEEFGSLAAYIWGWGAYGSRGPSARQGSAAGVHSAVHGSGQGPEAAWMELRRPDHGLRLHAVDGPRQRPHRELFRTCAV